MQTSELIHLIRDRELEGQPVHPAIAVLHSRLQAIGVELDAATSFRWAFVADLGVDTCALLVRPGGGDDMSGYRVFRLRLENGAIDGIPLEEVECRASEIISRLLGEVATHCRTVELWLPPRGGVSL